LNTSHVLKVTTDTVPSVECYLISLFVTVTCRVKLVVKTLADDVATTQLSHVNTA